MTKMTFSEAQDEELTTCGSRSDLGPELTVYEARSSTLGGGLTIRRALPLRQRRMIGPWCFLDHFGPLSLDQAKGMDVAPHPHIGLQTVTWLLDGEVLHTDSIGSRQLIRPGQLNVMTSGRGISHSEETPEEHSDTLHGVQFWVALPDGDREQEPAFEHHAALPDLSRGDLAITLVAGDALGERSPATVYSPMMGLDVHAATDGDRAIGLDADWEHGVVVLEGSVTIDDHRSLSPGEIAYLGCGRDKVQLRNEAPARFVVVGGRPFGEEILMWWNFVARTRDEIARAREDWAAGADYFGAVELYDGDRLDAPTWRQRPIDKG